jgi:formylglycine-generating enzyme
MINLKHFIRRKLFFQLTVFMFLGPTVVLQGQYDPEMVPVKGGSFMMGNSGSDAEIDEIPAHEVTVNTFRIAKTETTVFQWKAFCKATGKKMPDPPTWDWIDNHPIVNITWQDAMDYCNWLSGQKGEKYRLPTEAEWEYAARGGQLSKGTKYSGGAALDVLGWFSTNSYARTQPVAQKQPNELGIYDMSGNAWEWCQDWYSEYYYAKSPKDNPTGPQNGARHVMRGGSWFSAADNCKVTHRITFAPADRYSNYGFRVAISK